MQAVCLYFQVHQPFRLKKYRFLDIGKDHRYFDDDLNCAIMRRVAKNCYLKTNEILLKTIRKHKGQFKLAFSISGLALDQFELYSPEVIDSFCQLAQTGHVEFLGETYAHSLSSVISDEAFKQQVRMHSEKTASLFGLKPNTFRNTELIYSNQIGRLVAGLGFQTILTEGALKNIHSNNFMAPHCSFQNPELHILLRNYRLSDDLAFRFSDQTWKEHPLDPVKYSKWISDSLKHDHDVCNLFMDYETFGEHQNEASGIFDFITKWPSIAIKNGLSFFTPTEITARASSCEKLNVPNPISWADEERDLSAWLGNELQNEAFDKLYQLQHMVAQSTDSKIQKDWLYLQCSDHFYYMCNKFFTDGSVHAYFNPYESPYNAFVNYMNILSDFEKVLKDSLNMKDEKDLKIAELEQKLKDIKRSNRADDRSI